MSLSRKRLDRVMGPDDVKVQGSPLLSSSLCTAVIPWDGVTPCRSLKRLTERPLAGVSAGI